MDKNKELLTQLKEGYEKLSNVKKREKGKI